MIAVFLSVYAGAAIFLLGCVLRVIQFARHPMHLRWELYPVPHEAPEHAAHGGSYFEASNWWLSGQTVRQGGAVLAMAREIFLLKGVWEFNRRLWLPSFLFHFGLYLTFGFLVLQFSAGAIGFGDFGALLTLAAQWVGLLGILFVLSGSLVLLAKRILDPALANFTKPADIFNLVFFIAAFGCVAGGILRSHAHGGSLHAMAYAFVRFDRSIPVDPLLVAGLVLCAALVAYIPFTHMSHFIAKYFTWHEVRWDDRRNERGSSIEQRLEANLQYKPTWAAAHVHADGRRTWAEIATENQAQEKRP